AARALARNPWMRTALGTGRWEGGLEGPLRRRVGSAHRLAGAAQGPEVSPEALAKRTGRPSGKCRPCRPAAVAGRRAGPSPRVLAGVADVLVAADAGERQLDVVERRRVQVLLPGVLGQRVGRPAEVVAVQLVLRRAERLPLGLLAEGDQRLGVVGDLVEV